MSVAVNITTAAETNQKQTDNYTITKTKDRQPVFTVSKKINEIRKWTQCWIKATGSD